MKAALFYRGLARVVLATAGLTMRGLTRSRLLLVLALVLVVYLALHAPHPGARPGVASGLFLEHAYAGLQALLILFSLFFGLGAARVGEDAAAIESRRFAGEAAWYWGRTLGLLGILLAVAFGGAALTWVHHTARFGDAWGETRPLRRHVVAESWTEGPKERALMRIGDELRFQLPAPTGPLDEGKAPLVIRVAPRLAIARDGDPQRADYPLKWQLVEPGGRYRRGGQLSLRRGRAARIFTEYRGEEAPEALELRLTKIDPEYRVRLRPDDIVVFAESRSFVGALLGGALLCALYASIFGAIALFFAPRIGAAGSLIVAGGLAVIATSLDALAYGPLDGLAPWPREAILGLLRLAVPDLDLFDVPTWLARGRAPTLVPPLQLAGRALLTAFTLGVLTGLLGLPRRKR